MVKIVKKLIIKINTTNYIHTINRVKWWYWLFMSGSAFLNGIKTDVIVWCNVLTIGVECDINKYMSSDTDDESFRLSNHFFLTITSLWHRYKDFRRHRNSYTLTQRNKALLVTAFLNCNLHVFYVFDNFFNAFEINLSNVTSTPSRCAKNRAF